MPLNLLLLISFIFLLQLVSSAAKASSLRPETLKTVGSTQYILGPGDTLRVEFIGIPELTGAYTIGPDGTIYVPNLRSLYVEGLTVEELRYFLKEQYAPYLKDPRPYVAPISYRSVRVYVGGEISRPGYYMLSSGGVIEDQLKIPEGTTPKRLLKKPANCGRMAQRH